MSTTQTVRRAPPVRDFDQLPKTMQYWFLEGQTQLPLRAGDTSAGGYSEALPPAGLNSTTGTTAQNSEIIYIKVSNDANNWTITGAATGSVTLTAQWDVARFKSDGTNWYAVCCGAGGGSGPALQVNGTPNADQALLNLQDSDTVAFEDLGAGAVTAHATVFTLQGKIGQSIQRGTFIGDGSPVLVDYASILGFVPVTANDIAIVVTYEGVPVNPGTLYVVYTDTSSANIFSTSATDASAIRYIVMAFPTP